MSWKFSRYAVYLPIALLIMSCAPGKYEIAFPQQTATPGAPRFNLTGQWTSQYQCPSGRFYPITVRIDQTGQQMKAVKTTGDPCVAAGQTAFYGNLTGNSGRLTCYYVTKPTPTNPSRYGIGTTPGTLRVITANSFDACGLRFVRVAGPAPPPPGMPAVRPGVKNVAPQNSPVQIWVPNSWINIRNPYTSQFHVTFSDPNDEVAVGFRFINNWNTARSENLNLVSWLGQNLLIRGSMGATGPLQNIQISGMQAEFQEFKGRFNAPGQADHGQSVDLAVALVFVPGYNRAVSVVSMGLSNNVPRHQRTTRQILTSLAPRP